MTLSARLTPYGRDAAVQLHTVLQAIKRDDPLAPATIVVPTNYAGISVRRLLGSGELGPITPGTVGIAGIQLTTVPRLAETIGAPALNQMGRRPATTPVIAAAVRAVLDADPGVFAAVAHHTATVEALVDAHRELGSLDGDDLDRVAATGRRPGDVIRIHRTVRQRLHVDFYEVRDLVDAAIDAVPSSPAVPDLGTIVVYLPQRLSRREVALVRALGERSSLNVIVGLTGDPDADADVHRTMELLDTTLGTHSPPRPTATRVISTSDAEEECRSAVGAVVDALRGAAGEPLAPERIAILYPSAEPYARTLRGELDAAGIAWNGQRVDPVVESMVGRWVLHLLRVAHRGWRRTDVMRLLAEGPVVRATDDGGRQRVPVGPWERLSREAGVIGGMDGWDAALQLTAADHRAAAHRESASDDPRQWLIDRHSRSAEDADALNAFVHDLADLHRAHLDEAATWTAMADGLRHLVTTLLDSRWERWPDGQRGAAERVDLAIRRLTALDGITHAPTPSPLVCAEILERELTDDLGRHGTFGRGVLVGPLGWGVGLDLDLVVVMGLAEGVTPAPTADDPLLHDDERAVVAGALRLRRDRPHLQHRHVIAALAAGRDQRLITWSRGDLRRSAQREPSRWLEALAGGPHEHVPSYAGRVAGGAFPSTSTMYRLAALHRDGPDALDAHPIVAADIALRRGAALVTARRGPTFTRFDGDVSSMAVNLTRLDAAPTSASRLEAWAGCPHQYLMRYVLRVEPLEVPDTRLDITALDRGSLIHDVLERWLGQQLAAGTVPAPDQPWSPAQRRALHQIASTACDDLVARGLTGHGTLWAFARRQILRDLHLWLDHDDEQRRRHRTTPVAVELPFGGSDEHTPDPIMLADGTALRLRGRIDRVDRTAAGGLRVIDYKTGRALAERDLEDPVRAGRSLQLSLYARALGGWGGSVDDDHRADYWYITSRGAFAVVGMVVDEGVRTRQEEVLGVIVDGIHGGIFVANPDRSTNPYVSCWYCDPDGLGTAELGARFERLARTAPGLRRYVEMVEPDLLDLEEGEETAA